MTYTLMFYLSPEYFADRADPEKGKAFYASFQPYANALRQAGVVTGGVGLLGPETATTIKVSDGQRLVQDGPFSDTKEQLGGFFIIDVPDLDAALEWAGRYPFLEGGGVEVRPNLPPLK